MIFCMLHCNPLQGSTETFLSGVQKMGVQLLWDAENFHPHHVVFNAQKMLDLIMRICISFLKLGFIGNILFLLFQNMSGVVAQTKILSNFSQFLVSFLLYNFLVRTQN